MTTRNTAPGPTRFQFDTVFAADNVRGLSGGSKGRSTFAADEVESIRKEAHATGRQEALAEATHAQAVALSAIAQSATALIEQFDRHIERVRQDSAALALVVARKLAGGALLIAPQIELERFLSDCLHKLYREARLVVTVTPDNADYLRSRLEDLVAQNGFSGRIVIMPEPAMGPGDCRIEWAEGGIEKNLEATFSSIEERLRQWQPSQFTEGEQS
jgi:flagellar assembly protein FliH